MTNRIDINLPVIGVITGKIKVFEEDQVEIFRLVFFMRIVKAYVEIGV